nr:cyclin-J-like protein isoform X3 [Pongo pygmaeus]XP_054412146.1 cyclin-J-like protein isoform X4 [Pongo abelii]
MSRGGKGASPRTSTAPCARRVEAPRRIHKRNLEIGDRSWRCGGKSFGATPQSDPGGKQRDPRTGPVTENQHGGTRRDLFPWELKLPTFRAHSPLLKSRRFFVDILTLLSSHCQLCPAARHLAVYLLDHFMDRYNVTTSKQLYTVAVSCLLLANHIFYKFQPSVVAAACVGASRICLQLSPYWTRDLQRISSYSLEHLSTCIEILLVVYDNVLKDAVAVKSQALAMVPGTPPTPTQVLFQPPAYPALGQPATSLAQLQTPVQDLCLAYRDSLQAHRSGSLLSGSTGSSLHTPYPPLQPLDMCPVPVPASLSMQMAIAAEPRHCLATTYGSSYFSGSHMFPTGCFDR